MKKVSIIIILIIMFNNIVAYTNNDLAGYKVIIDRFLQNEKIDLFGQEGEKLYFQLRDYYIEQSGAKTKLGKALKTFEFDRKALKIQKDLTLKTWKQNKGAYGAVILAFVSVGLSVEAFSQLTLKQQEVFFKKLLSGDMGAIKILIRQGFK